MHFSPEKLQHITSAHFSVDHQIFKEGRIIVRQIQIGMSDCLDFGSWVTLDRIEINNNLHIFGTNKPICYSVQLGGFL